MDPTEITPKVKFGKTLVIHGDDWQMRIFSSASQPRHPEKTYWVLSEDAYGDQSLQLRTEACIDAELAMGVKGTFSPTPNSLEDALRMANLDRSMNEYSFPAPTPIEMKDL